VTIFDVVAVGVFLAAVISGARVGYGVAGVTGGIGGALVGAFAGFAIGRLPFLIAFRWARRRFRRQSTDDLRSDLASKYYIVHLILGELMRRGEDISGDLPVLLGLLSSDASDKRDFGLAGLRLGFPELAKRIRDYDASESVTICRSKVARFSASVDTPRTDAGY